MVKERLLVEQELYLKAGAHIGTKYKKGEMLRFIHKKRADGLNLFDIEEMDKRIRIAAKFIARYPIERVVVVSRKLYAWTPVNKFCEITGAKAITGRFIPGTFTNPESRHFIEAALLIAVEPNVDREAIKEAEKLRIPVVALASTNNSLSMIDLVIPTNNKGRKSLALVFWLLTREVLKEIGTIKKDKEFEYQPSEFEYQLGQNPREEKMIALRAKLMKGKKRRK